MNFGTPLTLSPACLVSVKKLDSGKQGEEVKVNIRFYIAIDLAICANCSAISG